MEEFVAGRGLVTRWEAVNRNNHYLDALALACVAGHGIGQRLVSLMGQTSSPSASRPGQRGAAEEPPRPRGGGWLGETSSWMGR